MKEIIKPIAISLFILSMMGCSILPSSDQTPTPSPMPAFPPSGYEPQPGDDQLTWDQAFVELEGSSLAIMESYPIQVSVILNGNLPDPCHQLRVVAAPAIAEKRINLEVYSVTDPGKVCITVLQPFSATVGLGSYPTGHYSVFVNGKLLGEFDA